MEIQSVKQRLQEELAKRDLTLVWSPDTTRLGSKDLVVFGVEQSIPGKGKLLVAGFGPGGFDEKHGNAPASSLEDFNGRFIEALEAVGIPKNSLHSNYPHVGRGKIWPTFVARLTQRTFQKLAEK